MIMIDKILSVIIPSYNMEAYLPKCLGSLVVSPELMDRLEVLVVNDGSKDRTSEIAHEFEKKYPQTFKVIDKTNGHYGSCVNAGLAVATGKYVKILDADDYVDGAGFAKMLVWMTELESEKIDLFLTDFLRVDENGSVLNVGSLNLPANQVFSIWEKVNPEIQTICHQSIAYRTELLRRINYKQTEGVPYTDTEWFSIPMALMARSVYKPIVVNHYLVGRVGQSVEKETLRKNFWVFGKLFLNSIQQMTPVRNCACEEGWNYLKKLIEKNARFIYATSIFDKRYNINLKDVDITLQKADSSWFDFVSEMRFSRRLPVRFVVAWRSGTLISKALLAVCRLYAICVKCVTGK